MDLLGTAGGLWTNRQNREFAEEMASTQYQRAVKDMKAAGLSPNAVFGSGGGTPAAAPEGKQENPIRGSLGSTVKGIAETQSTVKGSQLKSAETEVKKGEARLVNAQAANAEVSNDLLKAQTSVAQSSARQAATEAAVSEGENRQYLKSLGTGFGSGISAFSKYASPLVPVLGAGAAIAKGIGNYFGGRSSAKQVPPTPAEVKKAGKIPVGQYGYDKSAAEQASVYQARQRMVRDWNPKEEGWRIESGMKPRKD